MMHTFINLIKCRIAMNANIQCSHYMYTYYDTNSLATWLCVAMHTIKNIIRTFNQVTIILCGTNNYCHPKIIIMTYNNNIINCQKLSKYCLIKINHYNMIFLPQAQLLKYILSMFYGVDHALTQGIIYTVNNNINNNIIL